MEPLYEATARNSQDKSLDAVQAAVGQSGPSLR